MGGKNPPITILRMTIFELLLSLRTGQEVTFYGADRRELAMIEVKDATGSELICLRTGISKEMIEIAKDMESFQKEVNHQVKELIELAEKEAEKYNE